MGAKEIRDALRNAVRGIWSSPDADSVVDALSSAAESSGFAACLENLMESGNAGPQSYRRCAVNTGIDNAYRSVWGKPAKARRGYEIAIARRV